MLWPRAWASRRSAKVESPAMRMRSIGSICAATVRGMGVRSRARSGFQGSVDLKPIRVRLVTGKPPPRDEDGVAPQGQACRPRVSREPYARGAGDPPPLSRADRNRRDFEIGPRVDFDKGDRAAAPRDEIDFASGDDKPPRENRIAHEETRINNALSIDYTQTKQ